MKVPEIKESPQLQSSEDKSVWDAFRNGNKEALEIIYRRYINDLFNYGMKVKDHRNLVKDCIQELFVELWHSKENLSPTNNIKYYLLRALKFKIIHHLKREFRHDELNIQNSLLEKYIKSHETVLVDDQINQEQNQKLYAAMAQLPPRQREILHLLFFKELSYEKVSELMSINVKSVYTLAWKALSVLRKKLKTVVLLLSFLWPL